MKIKKQIVELLPAEQQQCIEFGKAIYQNKVSKGFHRPSAKGFDPIKLDILTVMSEYALAKYLDVPYKFELFDGHDEGDVVVNGYKIDVKMILKFDQLYFDVRKLHLERSDLFVGVKKKSKYGQLWQIVGWVWRNQIEHNCQAYQQEWYGKNEIFYRVEEYEQAEFLLSSLRQ